MTKMEAFDLPRSEWEILIDEWIMHERDNAILKRSLLDGRTYEQIAEEYGMSPRQVARIVPKARDRVFRHVKRRKTV